MGLLDGVTERKHLEGVILALGSIFDVRHTMYHVIGRSGQQIGIGTYSAEWQAAYVASNFARVDPVVRSCLHSRGPIHWNQLDWSSPGAGRFLSNAIDAGVGNQGMSVPLHGQDGQFALFTISTDAAQGTWQAQGGDLVSDMAFVAQLLSERALRIVDSTTEKAPAALSPRENDVLSLLAAGFTRLQAADYLGISEHTVRVYLETARRKLGAANTLHTVARAQTLGLLAL